MLEEVEELADELLELAQEEPQQSPRLRAWRCERGGLLPAELLPLLVPRKGREAPTRRDVRREQSAKAAATAWL